MSAFQCPFCSVTMPITPDTCRTHTPSFEHSTGVTYSGGVPYSNESKLNVTFFKCPKCHEYTICISGEGKKVTDISTRFIRPSSLAQKFPTYIPEAIRHDYEEACAIVDLSPKASATLSRRCLQGMIRDFWSIKENTLYQ